MAKFKFTAIGPDGGTITGVEEALTAGMARRLLVGRDLEPIEVTEQRSLLQYEITKKKVARRELMHFSTQLAVFMRAGIPILDSLEALTEEMPDKVFKRVLGEMTDALRSGVTFADAAADHPEAFPNFYVSVLRSAELTGTLDAVLDQLAEYIERDLDARRKISSALVYPAIVMAMSIVAICVITIFVLPRFQTFFSSLHAKLPLVTRILIDITHGLRDYWYAFAAGAALIVGGVVAGWTTERGRNIRDTVILRLPVAGELVRDAVLERFCRILSSLSRAGVPLTEALAVTAASTSNGVYRRGLEPARQAMLRGEGLAGPLAATGLFPGAARQMLRVGEETGSLDDQLEAAATYFDRELEFQLKRFTSLVEPVVIIVMGVIVGFVAIALVSALYGIFRQVKV